MITAQLTSKVPLKQGALFALRLTNLTQTGTSISLTSGTLFLTSGKQTTLAPQTMPLLIKTGSICDADLVKPNLILTDPITSNRVSANNPTLQFEFIKPKGKNSSEKIAPQIVLNQQVLTPQQVSRKEQDTKITLTLNRIFSYNTPLSLKIVLQDSGTQKQEKSFSFVTEQSPSFCANQGCLPPRIQEQSSAFVPQECATLV